MTRKKLLGIVSLLLLVTLISGATIINTGWANRALAEIPPEPNTSPPHQSLQIDEGDETKPEDDAEDEDEYWYLVETAAQAIGIDEETLWTALENGQSVAEIAQANKVDPQTVIDALITAENEFIDELLADGDISAQEADEWRAEVNDYITDEVYATDLLDDDYFDLEEDCDKETNQAIDD